MFHKSVKVNLFTFEDVELKKFVDDKEKDAVELRKLRKQNKDFSTKTEQQEIVSVF